MQEKLTELRPDDLTNYVDYFIDTNDTFLKKQCYNLYETNSSAVFKSFQETIKETLNNARNRFIEKNYRVEYAHLDKYFFGAIHWKVKAIKNASKGSKIICPGCIYNNRIEHLLPVSNGLFCNTCNELSQFSKSDWEQKLSGTFMLHQRGGYQCPSCRRFIPKNNQEKITCPYPDCYFVGEVAKLKKMNHPRIKVQFPEVLTGIPNGITSEAPCLSQVDEELKHYYQVVREAILDQQNGLEYTAWSSTYVNKWCMYQAFLNLLEQDQEEMVSYLAKLGKHQRKSRTQIKIIQEFIRLIEPKIPFTYTKAGKTFEVKSLLDSNLNLFDGESIFRAKVNNLHEIPNMTKEYYVGSRTGKYCLPYYIGKVIEVRDLKTNRSLINDVIQYSFVDIKMKESVEVGTEVEVKHYRLPSHYCVGAMAILNRIRKSIYDLVKIRFESNNA